MASFLRSRTCMRTRKYQIVTLFSNILLHGSYYGSDVVFRFPKLTEQYFNNSSWPAVKDISDFVEADSVSFAFSKFMVYFFAGFV